MRCKLLFFTACFLFLISSIHAQSSLDPTAGMELLGKRRAELAEINNMEFRKVFADYEGGYSVDYEHREWEEALFFDADGLVRKSIHRYSFPEGDGYYEYYYDKEGVCIFAISGSFSGNDGDVSVQVVRDDEGNWLHMEYIENNGDGLDIAVKHIIRNGFYAEEQLHQLPEMADGSLSYYRGTQELLEKVLSKYGIDSLATPEEYVEVRFVTPRTGDTTHVNYNYVPVYKNADEFSPVVGRINISHLFKVIETSSGWLKIKRPSEGDSTYGYKELIGYIRQDLAEPVEKIIGIVSNTYPAN